MSPLIRTARLTGLFYLGLAVSGMLGFLIIRPRLFAADDPGATLANLVAHEQLAHAGVALELVIVATQALAAVWFYRLFRDADRLTAGSIAAYGMVNAVVILTSAAMLATAVGIAREPFGDAASGVHLLYLISDNLWGVGALFFGLWLIPMGRCVLTSGLMPRPLGWVLIGGGLGYVLSVFVDYLIPAVHGFTDVLTLPATVGELWMVGYLLTRGVRRRTGDETPGESLDGQDRMAEAGRG